MMNPNIKSEVRVYRLLDPIITIKNQGLIEGFFRNLLGLTRLNSSFSINQQTGHFICGRINSQSSFLGNRHGKVDEKGAQKLAISFMANADSTIRNIPRFVDLGVPPFFRHLRFVSSVGRVSNFPENKEQFELVFRPFLSPSPGTAPLPVFGAEVKLVVQIDGVISNIVYKWLPVIGHETVERFRTFVKTPNEEIKEASLVFVYSSELNMVVPYGTAFDTTKDNIQVTTHFL